MAATSVERLFSRRTLAFLAGIAASSLGLAVAFLIAGGPEAAEVASAGADSFSHSALGHRAFVSLLRGEGIPVVVSRHDSSGRAARSAVLVVAEPRLESARSDRAQRMGLMLGGARTALLVLPKWTGREDPARPGWIADAELLPREVVGYALSAASIAATVSRGEGNGGARCEGAMAEVTLTSPQLLAPTTKSLKPLIRCPGGVLLGVLETAHLRLLVLSDPDVLSNHGLARGQNARLLLEIVWLLRHGGQALVVDETLHGHGRVPSVWRELFAFPFLPAVAQAALTFGVLVWSGLGRFGSPLSADLALAPGKGVLIENTAFLLRSAGYSAFTLGRYYEAALAEVGRALHAPPTVKVRDLQAWLSAAGRRRGVRVELSALEAQVARVSDQQLGPAAVLRAARRIHRWKEEMLRGPHDHSSG